MDSNDLVRMIKKAAVDAVNASKPVAVVYGKVTAENPLKIQIDQKLTLSQAQLVLTESVTDREIKLKSGEYTYTYTIDGHLKTGEKVVMLRCAGGQQYIVIDRMG